jgi:hypothetical protein
MGKTVIEKTRHCASEIVAEIFYNIIKDIDFGDNTYITQIGPPDWNPCVDIYLNTQVILRVVLTDSTPNISRLKGLLSHKKIGFSKYNDTVIVCDMSGKSKMCGFSFSDPDLQNKIKEKFIRYARNKVRRAKYKNKQASKHR